MNRFPDFLIIGERRSGTSTLSKWMEVHPDLYFMPHLDLGSFLDPQIKARRNWLNGKIDLSDWERSFNLEAYCNLFTSVQAERIIGEKSADYLFWKPCHERIRNIIPSAKLIVVLRNPVDRAWSHYWNEVGKGRESLSFEEAILRENERAEASDYAKFHLSYIARGLYAKSLNRLFRTFSSTNVHIVFLDDMKLKPAEVLKNVYKFCGLNTEKGLERAGQVFNHNWTTVPKSFWTQNLLLRRVERSLFDNINYVTRILIRDGYKRKKLQPKIHQLTRMAPGDLKMSPDTRERLRQVFRDDTTDLAAITGRKIDFWK